MNTMNELFKDTLTMEMYRHCLWCHRPIMNGQPGFKEHTHLPGQCTHADELDRYKEIRDGS